MLLISLEAKINADCLACRVECDIDTPNTIYAVSYAFIIGNTMRERERFKTAPWEAATKCLPFTTKKELVSSKLGHIYTELSPVKSEQGVKRKRLGQFQRN